jgi:D-arabinose 1-dehydrogenase-like Zn-dependent alcohol dehydrogenase
MQAAQISKPGGEWEVVERVIPEPRAGQVRVKVEACGICHSDLLVNEGLWPGLAYPRVPGHEIAGYIDAVVDNVTAWKAQGSMGGPSTICSKGSLNCCSSTRSLSKLYRGANPMSKPPNGSPSWYALAYYEGVSCHHGRQGSCAI